MNGSETVQLAVRAARALFGSRRFAFGRLAPDLTVVEASSNLADMVVAPGMDALGLPVTELLWELVGAEEALLAVARGELPFYRLDHVNRERADESIAYLTFHVTALEPDQPGRDLLLLVEDATSYGQLHQQLVQDRNELRLTQERMAEANEQLRQLNQMKSLFLAMAAHDMRTPLTSIFGFADILLEIPPADESERRKMLEIIRAQAMQLHRLIDDLLSLDQIEKNALTVHYGPFRLDEGIREVVCALGVQLAQRRVSLRLDLPETPLLIEADSGKIMQVLCNLVGNAAKYTPPGGEVRVAAYHSAEQVVIRVADNGPGMTPAQLSQLFSLYYRAEQARASGVEGSGLGLFIVKTVVDAHRGRVDVQSQEGQGTTFIVTLPIFGPDE